MAIKKAISNFKNNHYALTKNDFLDLISLHVQLKKQGAFFSGCCPFCKNTKEDSFSVYEHRKKWHCYSCRQVGNIYDFIEKTEHLSAEGAIKFINTFINLPPEDRANPAKNQPPPELKIAQPSKTQAEAEFLKIAAMEVNLDSELSVVTPIHNRQTEDKTTAPKLTSATKQPDNNKLMADLLLNFPDYQDIAIVSDTDYSVVASSINHLKDNELQELIYFIKKSFTQSETILGNDHSSLERLFQMDFSIDGNKKKLIWLPVMSEYHVVVIVDKEHLEKMFIMKLKDYFKKLETRELAN